MTADVTALANQLSGIVLRGIGKDLRKEDHHGARGAMVSALHGAIAHAASLAHLLAEFDRERAFCPCGSVAVGTDVLGARICGHCRRLEARALAEVSR